MSQEIEANETLILEEDKDLLDINRLKDANDSYEEILFHPDRKIVLRDGEFVLAIPKPSEMVPDETSEFIWEDWGEGKYTMI